MKNILLGITGSIAAYKSPELLKLLVNSGYIVKVLMTASAEKFITPLTCSVLTDSKVYRDVFDEVENMAHISLARWADIILIATASANFIAKSQSRTQTLPKQHKTLLSGLILQNIYTEYMDQ